MFNKVILVGRLTQDPQYSQTTSGVAVCRFTVACDRPFVNKQTNTREADFINCVAWRQTADFVNRFFTKGRVIIVEGSLRNDNYEKDGVKHYGMNVYVDSAHFAGSKQESGGSPYPNNSNYGSQGGYNGSQGGYNGSQGGYNGSQGGYNGGQGGYNGGQGGYNGGQGGYNGSQGGSNGGQQSGGSSQPAPSQNGDIDLSKDLSLGDLGEFEDIISDGEVPF